MIGMNCGYYNHKFEKKGEIISMDDGEFMQEMECRNCGITTYYPIEAFGESN
jgi:hypothetical protein